MTATAAAFSTTGETKSRHNNTNQPFEKTKENKEPTCMSRCIRSVFFFIAIHRLGRLSPHRRHPRPPPVRFSSTSSRCSERLRAEGNCCSNQHHPSESGAHVTCQIYATVEGAATSPRQRGVRRQIYYLYLRENEFPYGKPFVARTCESKMCR